MSDTNKITKKEIYTTIIRVFDGQLGVDEVDSAMYDAIIARMYKDIKQASKSTEKKTTDNDRLNWSIQDAIVSILTEKGTLAYTDLVKEVQKKYTVDIAPQRITANVTKIKDSIEKFEDGKGKNKRLYIKLA